MARRTMTYGTMPSREEFDAACAAVDPECGRSVDMDGFGFGNDPRVGSVTLTAGELWEELQKAYLVYDGDSDSTTMQEQEKAGDWISSVLSSLGFEWV